MVVGPIKTTQKLKSVFLVIVVLIRLQKKHNSVLLLVGPITKTGFCIFGGRRLGPIKKNHKKYKSVVLVGVVVVQ